MSAPIKFRKKPVVIEAALVAAEDREAMERELRTPDLYTARDVADRLGVSVSAVQEWRRSRGIRKATP